MKFLWSWEELSEIRKQQKREGKKVVFTNGCFDLIHAGHIDYLTKARALGDVLIVGLNSDASVKRLKGDKRPLLPEKERALALWSLKPVDFVAIFDEDTPLELISAIVPDVLVKGGDWALENIVGRDIVEANGGVTTNIPFTTGRSTTGIIKLIMQKYCR
ncbi:MAG: D-glycero-beta-D-manno-heptose 1-phosphate adenylyltransferase [Ignavibacteriaceae bacterium]|nr:MAG: D-glycero-beta-D-manno-heptose 1-phosphate adenylyltransferase [Ignavibacteriaceae bacterium]MBV6445989.1 Bifunctional protein HldE [Ignavibacteriaceae bacterium]MBW7872116.1 D-glycero-beta-D-manno-heptose 1-phosphate adenylyltransferase [Ignavibacteria bacterium]MBZ0197757.1 D-glycero-beta-D-manno-heptose 1-phosphate adenylyltransferase [Ignavibacteriaceae bacterium]OQY74336.1 MAG: D-glycero-beta-D-manno-heptose 1-phosphate adenylyltransferase [Ignavibacteriales bacterium UTCHB3]